MKFIYKSMMDVMVDEIEAATARLRPVTQIFITEREAHDLKSECADVEVKNGAKFTFWGTPVEVYDPRDPPKALKEGTGL